MPNKKNIKQKINPKNIKNYFKNIFSKRDMPNKNIMYRFFFMLSLPIIIVIFFTYSTNAYYSAQYQKLITSTYSADMDKFLQSTEDELLNIAGDAAVLVSIPTVNQASYTSDPSSLGSDVIQNAQTSLYSFSNRMNYTDSIIIVNPSADFVFSREGICPIDEYFNERQIYTDYNADYWINYRSAANSAQILLPTDLKNTAETGKKTVIPVVYPVIGEDGNSLVIFNISAQMLYDDYVTHKFTKNSQLYMINNKTGEIFDGTTDSAVSVPDISNAKKKYDTNYYNVSDLKVAKAKYFVLSSQNRYGTFGYTYVGIIPYSDINAQSHKILVHILLLAVLIIIIMLFYAYIGSVKLIKPWQNIAEKLSKTQNADVLITPRKPRENANATDAELYNNENKVTHKAENDTSTDKHNLKNDIRPINVEGITIDSAPNTDNKGEDYTKDQKSTPISSGKNEETRKSSKKSKKNKKSKSDDVISYVNDAITDLLNQNDDLSHTVAVTLPKSQEKYLVDILNNPASDYNEDMDSMIFNHQFFVSIAINISLKQTSGSDVIALNPQLYIEVYKAIESVFAAQFTTFSLPSTNNTLYLILNVENDNCGGELNETIDQINSLLAADSDYIDVFIGMGKIYKGIDGLRLSHQEAMSDIFHEMNSDKIQIVDNHNLHEYSFGVYNENILINYILTGRAQEAVNFIRDTFKSCSKSSPENRSQVYAGIYRAVGKVIKVKKIRTFDFETKPENVILEDILNSSDDSVMNYLISLTENISNLETPGGKARIAEIADYIKEHFNEDLCLDNLAQRFNVTPKYLSKVLKEHLGISFKVYLTSLRIDKAEELLKNKEIKINEICKMVGFMNHSAFIRAFKLKNGISPSEYRTLYCKK